MPDLTTYKVPIFTGINDLPRVPTNLKGGNGADLISRHNSLVAYLETLETGGGLDIPVITEEGTIYASPTGLGNGEGRTEDTAVTLNRALMLVSRFNPLGLSREVALLSGTYNQGISLPPFLPAYENEIIYIRSNDSDHDSVVIAGTGTFDNPIRAKSTVGEYAVLDMTLKNQGSNVYNHAVIINSRIYLNNIKLDLGAGAGNFSITKGSIVTIDGALIINNPENSIAQMADNSQFYFSPNLQFPNGGNFNYASFGLRGRSFLDYDPATVSGTVTGKRFECNQGSLLIQNGKTVVGSVAGTTLTGGQAV
jgi:hypothetical protein